MRTSPHQHTRATAPIAVDLFAGAGGLGEGLAAAGFRVAVANELHPQPALTYAFNHPGVRALVGPLQDLSSSAIQEHVGTVARDAPHISLIAGGPPCQGFSTAGKKRASDPRNVLFLEYLRVVRDIRPRLVLLENVPGFMKMHGGHARSNALEALRAMGYDAQDALLDASRYGVPQRRLRYVLVATMRGATSTFAWPEPTHASEQGYFFEPNSPLVTVRDALDDLSELRPGWEQNARTRSAGTPYQRVRSSCTSLVFNHLATQHRAKAVRMFQHIAVGSTISTVPARIRSSKRTMARLDPDSISNAVLALPDDLIHYCHDRIPTVREMARLQSFDDDFVFFGKRTSGYLERRVDVPQYTQVGNAVPPLLAMAIGRALLAAIDCPGQDQRDVPTRRQRHGLVCGTSGYSGYTLRPGASEIIELRTVKGDRVDLPISTDDVPVRSRPAQSHWKEEGRGKLRGQWAPGVVPRSVPAYERA